jgi:exoribonuclease-2
MKLLGPGEYALEKPGAEPPGHFGLAVKDYAHSTAPNRRFADLLTHRLFKAAMTGKPSPYSLEELESLARRCTSMEDAAKKVERQMNKSAVAMMLEDRVGEEFDALVTGRSDKGVWARIAHPPVEGRIVAGFDDLDVGDACVLRLVNADAVLGHIDFKRIRA